MKSFAGKSIFWMALVVAYLVGGDAWAARVRFSPPIVNGVGITPVTPATADFNGNGILDLAVTNSGDDSVGILLGKGDGTFLPQVPYPSGGDHPNGLVVADFNGNGTVDLALTNFLSNNVAILFGNGDGTFQTPVLYPVESLPQTLATGDFTGLGRMDLAVPNSGSNTISILLNNGDGTFQSAVSYPVGLSPQTIAVGDFNGNGFLDLAVANQNSDSITLLFGNGDGTFGNAVEFGVEDAPDSIAAGDFSGTNILDLAVGNFNSGTVTVLLGNGDGSFNPGVSYPVGAGPQRLTLADINGDGVLDILVPNSQSNSVSILLGNGDGTFQPAANYYSEAFVGPDGLAVGDFNRDGYLDLVVANPPNNTVAVALQKGGRPLLNSIRPKFGTTAGGTPVIIRGSNFQGTTAVLFGSTEANFQVVSSKVILATTPPGNPGSVKVRVRTPFGISAPVVFTYRVFPFPSPSLFPPRHAKGVQIHQKFATQTDIVNTLSWRAPSRGIPPLVYQIYRDADLTDLIAILPANAPLKFKDHNRKPDRTYSYFIVSVDGDQLMSEPVRLKVSPRG